MIDTKKQIKILCVHLGISQADLARRCNMSPQLFGQKLKNDTFSPADLEKIAEKVGCSYESKFVLGDGTKI